MVVDQARENPDNLDRLRRSFRLFSPNLNSLRRDAEIISVARIVLALACAVVLWQEEPDQRFHVDHFTPLLYAAASLPLLWSYATSINRRLQIAFHLADIAFAVAMLFAAEHAVVLFVMLSTFCLLSAAAQWRWSTVVATGLCLLSCYGASVFAGLIGDERLFIRTLFLALATCLLAWATQAREAQRCQRRRQNVPDGGVKVYRSG